MNNIDLFCMEDNEPACKHCGRVVLAGPPCCYDSLYEMYQKLVSDNAWLRKVQGKQEKRLQKLVKENEQLTLDLDHTTHILNSYRASL